MSDFIKLLLPLAHVLAVIIPASSHLDWLTTLLLFAMIPFYVLGVRRIIDLAIERWKQNGRT